MQPPVSMGQLRKHYRAGGNVMELMRNPTKGTENPPEAILASYDLQAGSYIEAMRDPIHFRGIIEYTAAIARLLDRFEATSVLEIGVGEAITLSHLLTQMQKGPTCAAGFDISWSRIDCARKYSLSQGISPYLFVGDMCAAPIVDSAFDAVYTSHSIEPNSGHEREALAQIMRIARRHVILLEPAATLGNAATKERIARHRYCQDLEPTARTLGYKVIEHRLFDVCLREDNQTELIILEKETGSCAGARPEEWLACPVCHTGLVNHKGHFFCRECCLIFPVIDDVPCLTPSAGILGSAFLKPG